jgi:hypothetical protein
LRWENFPATATLRMPARSISRRAFLISFMSGAMISLPRKSMAPLRNQVSELIRYDE